MDRVPGREGQHFSLHAIKKITTYGRDKYFAD
jgi:hypothetical protein